MLNRREMLPLLSGAAASAWLPALKAAAAPLTYALKPKSIGDGIWIVPGAQEAITTGNGGAIANITIFDSTEGAVIIDTGPSHAFGEALAGLARKLTGKDIARVYLTHFHPDHIFGNQAFGADKIAATDGVAAGLRELGEAFADAMYRSAGDWMRGTELVLPGMIIQGGAEDFGSRRIRALPMRGHTAADIVYLDELSGTLVAGDLVFLDRAPTTPHADIERWRISLANLGAIPCSQIVPGHGPSEATDRGLKQTREWLETVEEIVRGAFEKGLDITEAIALPLPQWTEKVALSRYEYERTVMHLYPKFEEHRWPRIDVNTP